MPPNFCLLPKYADELKERFASGALDVGELSRMSSADRHAALAEIVGDANAQHVNAAFESKLLLENQKKGLETWVRQTTEGKPEVQRDLLARVQRMDRVLEPDDRTGFLADLAKQKLGFGVTMEEAGHIAQLAKEASDTRAALDAGTGDRLAYGRAKVAFSNYVSELKNGVQQPMTVDGALKTAAGVSKSITVSLNNHALFRQGWNVLWSHPEVWYKNAKQSFVDLAQQFGGKEVLDEVKADIHSRPNALNGRYKKAGLAIGTAEEDYPSALRDLPAPVRKAGEAIGQTFVGRAYKASEAAFTAFQYRNRADVFDKYMEIAEQSGVDLQDKAQLESVGKLVNSLTARGHLGATAEPAADVLNVGLFSVRKLKADIDVLTAHQLQGGVTPFVRKQAAINLTKIVAGTAATLAVANMVLPGSVELDPRSADFGKIKVGHTRFEVTGGKGSIATLAARLLLQSSKSSTTGKVSKINSGKFGAATGADLVTNFLEGRASPAANVVLDLLKGQTRTGEKPTPLTEAAGLVTPITASNAEELYNDPKSAGVLLGTLGDALGIANSTYDGKKHHTKK